MNIDTLKRIRPWRALLLIGLAAAMPVTHAAEVESEFSFLHFSDLHINPQPINAPEPGPQSRSVAAIGWICEEAGKPQELAPLEKTVEPPVFAIATGDLTEYGVINTTWEHFERHFAPLAIPLYLTPGNHDNTWTAMLSIMRERHGGDHYAFERHGCHFICFDTATPQEPVPSIDRRTITWLENYLQGVERDTPIFMYCHHPLSSTSFSKPYEQLRLLQTIENHNVVLLLMGHGHAARHEKWGRLDSVMGGSTFGKNTGYGVVHIQRDELAVVYRYRDESKPMETLLRKPMPPVPAPCTIKAHAALAGSKDAPGVVVTLEIGVEQADPQAIHAARLRVAVDDQDTLAKEITLKFAGKSYETRKVRLPLQDAWPGRHFVRVHGTIGAQEVDRTCEFELPDTKGRFIATRVQLDAGMKAQPLVFGDDIIVATTGGQVVRLSLNAGKLTPKVLHDAGVEILHAPATDGERLYVSAAEKGVIALDATGKRLWTRDVGSVVYGTPVLDEEHAYVGDLQGNVHAIRLEDGSLAWSKHHALYSFEQTALLHEGILYLGAWDGFLYAIRCKDGELAWKSRTPAGHSGGKFTSRYYAGADASAIIVGERLVMADRAYRLGHYDLSGNYLGDLAEGVTAVAAAADGKGFYGRGFQQGVLAFDAKAESRWTAANELGRFPIPPTVTDSQIVACSNRGRLSIFDASNGNVLWKYQVTPRLPVMAPVTVTDRGDIIVADMDGVVTRLQPSS